MVLGDGPLDLDLLVLGLIVDVVEGDVNVLCAVAIVLLPSLSYQAVFPLGIVVS